MHGTTFVVVLPNPLPNLLQDHFEIRDGFVFEDSLKFRYFRVRASDRLTKAEALGNRLITTMFALLFDLEDYATTYRATRDAYLKAANELKLATGPYKASRDAYVAATATYTKSLYE